MKKLAYILLTGLLIVSCKGEEEQTLDFDDISKPSSRSEKADTARQEAPKVPVYFDSISAFSQQLVDSLGLNREQLFTLDTLIYPDRFGASATDKWYYLDGKDSLVFMRWDFRNNAQAKNAFFNWLDCYGSNCRSFTVGDKASFSKRATMFLLGDKELIFVESGQRLPADKLLLFATELEGQKLWDHFVVQPPRGKAEWKAVSADTLVRRAKNIKRQSGTKQKMTI